ncbi:MAG TPA: molecular chaperone HtpG [Anaerolineae bacterium]|nr:molecular chaperone HtpG [Anaerolineae bacterium]HQK14930.1 molecular chaperone HtpG [Anaerolineae bacterium]
MESLEFKAEVQQLLHILSHSLYTEREIFLRELISNASDALNRVQFEMLTNHNVLDPDAELAIRIDFDAEAKTLTVSDTGIGMTREELIENLGTIAHSGAMAFLKKLEAEQRLGDIIGQFGVGFYSVFMVADKVTVTSRSYLPEAQAWTWSSCGDNTYTISPAEKKERGTTIEIALKEDAAEFASEWRLEQIIKKHSNYISFPIYVKDKIVNQQTALWRKSPNEITAEEYAEFYRQLTLDYEKPLLHLHIVTDAPVDIRSVLYVPRSREHGIFRLRTDYGLRLYSRKVLIQENNKDMLPEYLRFIEGVVDSADIPLNVARESVQSSRAMGHIKKALRGRVLKALKELGDEKPDDYKIFWEAFGAFIKEGVATDFGGRDDLLPLLRFPTSKSNGALIALSEYVARMREGQTAIYYILGDDLNTVARSPHLDAFKARDLEVLYLVDPLDAFMVQSLREYEGKPLKNVDDPDLQLPDVAEDQSDRETAAELPAEVFGKLLLRFKNVLGERIKDVRESKVLKDSPCRLVSPDSGPEREMQRVRRLIEQDYEVPLKIIEINRSHPLIQNLARLVETQFANPLIDTTIEQLYENLLLLEGLHPNPAQMVPRIQTLLEQAVATSAQQA